MLYNWLSDAGTVESLLEKILFYSGRILVFPPLTLPEPHVVVLAPPAHVQVGETIHTTELLLGEG